METINEDYEKEIKIILRQTNYTREEVLEKLENEKDYKKIIKNYLGKKDITNKKKVSLNQQVYREIRDFMDQSKTEITNKDN
jgi:hypothetical protein